MNELLISLILILVKLGLIFGVVLSMAAYLVLAERKILGTALGQVTITTNT